MKILKFKMAVIFREEDLLKIGKSRLLRYPVVALSRTVKEIEANLCFSIFGKNSKIQNGRHFWGRGNFF